MNEYLTSLLVVFSEVGGVLALAALVVVFIVWRRNCKDRLLAKEFVATLRHGELARKENLIEILQKVHTMDHDLADKTAQAMILSEKYIYNRVLKIFLGHERDELSKLQHDVENMASSYRKLVDIVQTVETVERGENPKQNAHLRLQIKQLEAEKAKLEKDLAEAMNSMESMLKEYTQMYSGGARKEGVKHIENELVQLKQKISENLVEEVTEDSLEEESPADDVPDMQPDAPEKPATKS